MLGNDKLSKELVNNYLLEGLNEIIKDRTECNRSHFVNPDDISNEDIIVAPSEYLKNRVVNLINCKIYYLTDIIREINYIINNKNLGKENSEESTNTGINLIKASFDFILEEPEDLTHETRKKLISIKKDILKIVYGLMVISDDVSSNALSLEVDKSPYLEKFVKRCDDLLSEIINKEKSLSFSLKFRAFLKQANPFTVVGSGFQEKFNNMSISSKFYCLSSVTFIGFLCSSILFPLSFLTVIPLIFSVPAIFFGSTFKIAFQTHSKRYFTQKKSAGQDTARILQIVKSSVHDKVRGICSSGDISSMTLSHIFKDDAWRDVTDVRDIISHIIISCNSKAEKIFKDMVNEITKGLEDIKEQRNIQKKVSKLFSETKLLIRRQKTSSSSIRDDIANRINNFIKEFNEIIDKNSKENTIIESSTLKIFVDNPGSFFTELMKRLEQSSSFDRRVSTELDDVVVESHEHENISAINL